MTSSSATYVEVLYNYDYEPEHGETVCIQEGEILLLLEKTNKYWWHVARNSELGRSFYAPANYLNVLPNSPLPNGEKDENSNSLDEPKQSLTFVTFGSHSSTIATSAPLAFDNPLCALASQESLISSITDEDGTTDRSNSLDSLLNETGKGDDALKYEKPQYANLPSVTPGSTTPPIPTGEICPLRVLSYDWAQYVDGNGRKYYYNSSTQEITYKPPRGLNLFNQSTGSVSPSSSPIEEDAPLPELSKSQSSSSIASSSKSPEPLHLPPGYAWHQGKDGESYIVDSNNKKWFFTLDPAQQRIYFFNEDSSTSLWELPELSPQEDAKSLSNSLERNRTPPSSIPLTTFQKVAAKLTRDKASRNLVIGSPESTLSTSSPTTPEAASVTWPSLQDGNLVILKQGPMNRSKLLQDIGTPAGHRKAKKGWQPSWLVLTDLFLLFYKESQKQVSTNKPDVSIDLNGAIIAWCPDFSRRKNVFLVKSLIGHQVFLQDDSPQAAREWLEAISSAISSLPKKQAASSSLPSDATAIDVETASKKGGKVSRSKSTRCTRTTPNKPEESFGTSPSERKRIRDRLKQFFLKRPTLESLKEKGIFKDEPVFGSTIGILCSRENTTIPNFVRLCIEAIEKKDLSTDGLYRASGNISQIQRIRLNVNHDKYKCLEQEEDVHVLTGALKMFFRNLAEPLFPFSLYEGFLRAAARPDTAEKLARVKDMVQNSLPAPNRSTLAALLQHLLKVCQFSRQNRMDIKNLAIVFGPTLLWADSPCQGSTDLALKMMLQSHLVEFLLLEYKNIFAPLSSSNTPSPG